ncbi:MAG TPA: FGGY family carbohydrate kinase [Planctomycetota bacterium]|jgi:sedoheptulokinase
MKFIGIDTGTTSICGVAMDMRTGKIRSVYLDNASWIRSRRPWEHIQDPAKIESTVRWILGELLAAREPIAGIGLTGQMHGILYVRGDGAATGPLYTWQDGRGGLPLGRGARSYAEELSERTGYRLAPGFGMVTHWYNLKNGLVPRDAHGFCTIHDYLVMRLAGRKTPLMDPTDAASLGVFDLKDNVFDRNALTDAGIGLDLLPEVASSGTSAGRHVGVPVYTGVGDNQASFLSSRRR